MIISIVGLSGSGKSFITKTLLNYNQRFISLDIDKIGHQALENTKIKEKLIKSFGSTILKNNKVDRKVLGNIVFNSEEKMNLLTKITWTYMEKVIDHFINTNKDNIIILDWLLLPKTKYFKQSSLRILVKASVTTRMKRVMARDSISEDAFLLRDNAAPYLDENNFEYIITNEQLENTKKEVKLIYDKSIVHR